MKADDRARFGVAMHWLAKKYPLGREPGTGKPIPRQLNAGDLKEYFEALSDLSIEAIERGVKWHYGHCEFFPHQPASLRKSVEAAPPPPRKALPQDRNVEALPETPPEVAKKRLQAIFDQLNGRYGTQFKA